MKTFKDLQFEAHSIASHGLSDFADAKQARLFFPNGYGVSVISGRCFYTDINHPYEVAVLFGNEDNAEITYSTDITSDVIGHCTARKVTDIMKKVQVL